MKNAHIKNKCPCCSQQKRELVEKIKGMKLNLPMKDRYGAAQGVYNAALTDIIALIEN